MALENANMTFKEAAREILKGSPSALHAHEIARRAIARGVLSTTGKTPLATMEAMLCVAARAPDGEFLRTAPRTFALRPLGASPAARSTPATEPGDGATRAKWLGFDVLKGRWKGTLERWRWEMG